MGVLAKLTIAATTFAAATFAARDAAAQTLRSDEVLSSISVHVLSAPHPVAGSDARTHLAYELLIVNPSHVFVQVETVEALDQDRHSLSRLTGKPLTAMTTLYSGKDTMLPPGGSAAVFMDVAVAADAPLPARVVARITIKRQAAGADGRPAPWPADAPVPAQISFDGAETVLAPPATVVAPPLRGDGWVAINGCCDTLTSHRGAIMAVNGQLRVPERFAIDWVQLGTDRRVVTGDAGSLSSYRYYGSPVHAAAAGVVVNRFDGAEEQVPGADAKGITPETIGGNMLVVDIGGGAYAFYAHLQKGSLRVELGDRVTAGQAIALLGNTGNSTAPHLHFQLMDGPSPLDADSLPFTLTQFHSQGVLGPGSEALLEGGAPARIDAAAPASEHAKQMPLNNEVVDFR